MRFPTVLALLLVLAVPEAHALVFVAQPQESPDVGEEIFRPVAELLTRETGQPWDYQYPDNQLNYVDIIVEDRAELYLGDPHFVGYQVGSNRQRVLAHVPDQEWVLIAPQSSTGKLLGSRVTASFSCTEAPTCALPPPDLGLMLFSNMEVFANNPLRHPILVSVNDASKVVRGVLDKKCYCGVTRRALLRNVPESDREQLAVRELRTTLGAAFTVSERVSPALADQIQAALLSPAGMEATRAMRERLYGGAELVEPANPEAYADSAGLLIDEFLIPMRRLPQPGNKKTEIVDAVPTESTSQTTGPSGGPVELTVVSWGGAYSASQWKAYHEPYMAKNPNVTIKEEESAAEGLKLLREQETSGNIRWNVVDMTASNAIAACKEGLAMEITHDEWLAPAPDGTPPSKDFGDMIVAPCFVPQIVFSTAFGYRHDLLSRAPGSIEDVFNLKEFPGGRSLERKPINNLEWALIADGVPADQVYDLLDTPEGVERAFSKLDTIKDQVVGWWLKGDVPVKLLSEGTATIASAYNGRLFAAIVERNEPVSMLWDWQVFDLDGWVVPKGTPNLEAVREYLNFATDTQRLADQTKYISYGPARASSAPLVGKHAELGIDMAPHMPTDPANSQNVLLFNYEWWAEHQDDLGARFEAWLSGQAAAGTQAVSQTSGTGVELTVVSWGGAYSASQWKAYHEPYMKKNPDVTISEEESSAEGLKLLREQVESGNIRWDVVDMTASNAIAACEEGLAMKIPHDEWLAPAPDGTPATRDFGDMIVAPCFVPQIVFSTAFGYRHDLLSQAPDSIGDVFDLNRFPGGRSLERKPINNLEWALIADGVPADQVYDLLDTPEGVARAFAKLDTIKDKVAEWWLKGDVPVKLLSEGTVTIASAYNGRLFAAIVERNEPVSMMWDWQVFDLDGWVVPTGTAKIDAAREYLHFATDTQRLADQAKYISYGPARASSAPLVGKHAELGIDMAPHMPTDPANSKNVLLFNYEWWAEHQDDLGGRFEAWLEQ